MLSLKKFLTRKNQKKIKKIATVIIVAFIACSIPTLSFYKNWVRALFYRGHVSAAYYLNVYDAHLAVMTGDHYFFKGAYDLARAEHAYRHALWLDPHIRTAHYQLARIHFVQGNLARATTEIEQESANDPYTLRWHYVRGLIRIAQGNLAGAEQDFRVFVAWSPGDWGGYNDLAHVLAKEGKYTDAAAVITEALNKVPNGKDIPWLWNTLGVAQLNQLYYKEAMNSFLHARSLATTLTPAQWQRAYSANDPSEASASITRFVAAIDANISIARIGLGM